MNSLIEKFEGFSRKAYKCPAGVWTIGYGLTRYPDNRPVRKGDREVNPSEARNLLNKFLSNFVFPTIKREVEVDLNPNQVEALGSFIFNIGSSAFVNSTLLYYLNKGWYKKAAREFLKWNKATVNGKKKRLSGLTKRRRAERKLFLKKPKIVHRPEPKKITLKKKGFWGKVKIWFRNHL